MKSFIVYCLLLIVSSLLFISVVPVSAQSPQLRIMTYNVNRENLGNDDAFAYKKMEDLAQYIIDNKIDIVALQEVTSWKTYTYAANKILEDDDVRLKAILEKKGYPMHFTFKQQAFHVSTLSRFPVISGSYTEKEIPDTGRIIISTSYETPIGKVRILNLHVQSKKDVCNQSWFIDSYIHNALQSDVKNLIALGDWNAALKSPSNCNNFAAKYDFFCKRGCGPIDLIVSPKGNSFIFVDGWGESGVLHSDHMPQVAVLSSTIAPSSTPTPTVTNIPTIRPSTVIEPSTPQHSPTPSMPSRVSPFIQEATITQPKSAISETAPAPTSSITMKTQQQTKNHTISLSLLDWILSYPPRLLLSLQQQDIFLQKLLHTHIQ